MRRLSYPADRPTSYAKIERAAQHVRRVLSIASADPMPGLPLFERLDELSVKVGDRTIPLDYAVEPLPVGVEAQARYEEHGGRIVVVLGEGTYHGLHRGDLRPRFSFAHELGHACLHATELVRLARLPEHAAALQRGEFDDHPIYQDVEWQADAFAGAILVPGCELADLHSAGGLTPIAVTAAFQVSAACAKTRIAIYAKQGGAINIR